MRGGEAFFLARKVKEHFEKAVALNPDNIEARFDLLEYYLQASYRWLVGAVTKAKDASGREEGSAEAECGEQERKKSLAEV